MRSWKPKARETYKMRVKLLKLGASVFDKNVTYPYIMTKANFIEHMRIYFC